MQEHDVTFSNQSCSPLLKAVTPYDVDVAITAGVPDLRHGPAEHESESDNADGKVFDPGGEDCDTCS